jgi:hypothetical protein
MRCAKVIVFYFGQRRIASNNSQIIDLLPEIIQNETQIDVGYDTDTFFVINDSQTEFDNLLDEYDGYQTKNGKIRVIKRPNIGMSFGGYIDIFNKFKNEYDYWMFLEDDVIVYRDGYISEFINYLESSDATFVALAPISHLIRTHCGGGCGLTSTKYMEQTYTTQFIDSKLNEWSNYSGYDVTSGKLQAKNAEIEFTSYFKLQNHSKFSPLASNCSKHSTQTSYKHLYNSNFEFIYKVGK